MAGIITLKDLIDGVREHLASEVVTGALNGAINASVESLVLVSSTVSEFVEQKGLLEIEDEVIRVVSWDAGTNTAIVIRGYQGSTPATHVDTTAVKIHPPWGWTDRVIRFQHIFRAISWLKPMSWSLAVSDTFDWPASSYVAQLPTNAFATQPAGNQIYAIELQDASGNFLQFDGWQHIGPFVRFKSKATTTHKIHALLIAYQVMPQNLLSTLDDDEFAEAIEFYAASLAVTSLKTNRVRFVEYSASLNDRASTIDELIRMSFDLKNQAVLAKEKAFKPIPATYLKTYRPPAI